MNLASLMKDMHRIQNTVDQYYKAKKLVEEMLCRNIVQSTEWGQPDRILITVNELKELDSLFTE